jgi:hypothetical protein
MSKDHLKEFIGFGIAGNFAHHLDQAGEAADFVNVVVEEENAPKGIFPFYLPNSDTFLGTYPLSSNTLVYPRHDDNLQMEPEVGLICELKYDGSKVIDLVPNYFTAYNDATIRKEGASKISQKKNWAEQTKGISSHIIPIDKFEHGGIMDSYHIASFIKRDGTTHMYGQDSAVITYNYFYEKLKNWIIKKLNEQQDNGPLEDLSSHLKSCDYPTQMIISIGATSYTDFGENNYLKIGDECFVFIYDSNKYSLAEIEQFVKNDEILQKEDISILKQTII